MNFISTLVFLLLPNLTFANCEETFSVAKIIQQARQEWSSIFENTGFETPAVKFRKGLQIQDDRANDLSSIYVLSRPAGAPWPKNIYLGTRFSLSGGSWTGLFSLEPGEAPQHLFGGLGDPTLSITATITSRLNKDLHRQYLQRIKNRFHDLSGSDYFRFETPDHQSITFVLSRLLNEAPNASQLKLHHENRRAIQRASLQLWFQLDSLKSSFADEGVQLKIESWSNDKMNNFFIDKRHGLSFSKTTIRLGPEHFTDANHLRTGFQQRLADQGIEIFPRTVRLAPPLGRGMRVELHITPDFCYRVEDFVDYLSKVYGIETVSLVRNLYPASAALRPVPLNCYGDADFPKKPKKAAHRKKKNADQFDLQTEPGRIRDMYAAEPFADPKEVAFKLVLDLDESQITPLLQLDFILEAVPINP